MTEWLLEAGIGETRAALVEHGRIIEAAIERDDNRLRAGAVIEGRLATILVPRKRGIVSFSDGGEALIEPIPAGVTEGAKLTVEIVREAIAEKGRSKLPKAIASVSTPLAAPTLEQRIRAMGLPVRPVPVTGPDLLEGAGWSELLDEALHGEIAFPGGGLRISLTPAMTLIDVDGDLPPADLALTGAAAAGAAIRRLDITGSIGIDLPTVGAKAARLAAAAALDEVLPQPFERTGVNGFGFIQIIRRRVRASIPELMQADPALATALALLRRAERAQGAGAVTLAAHAQVIDRIGTNPQWIAELERRVGARVRLQAQAGRSISASDVSREHA